jgi:hypothetical protein
MFAFHITSLSLMIVFVLSLIWFALLPIGFVMGTLNEAKTHRIATWRRMGSSLMLVFIAFVLTIDAALQDNSIALGYFALMAMGMLLGFVGDLFMAGLIGKSTNVLGGMGAFGVGHIFYIVGLLYAYSNLLSPQSDRLLLGWVIALVIGGVGWLVAVFLKNTPRNTLHYVALPYSLLLASTMGFALGLGLQADTFLWIALGAGLFLLSDLILSLELFRDIHFQSIGDVVWLTYGPGQMLIVLGLIVHPILF